MKLSELLRAVGLSKDESEVYLALLRGGTQTISGVARESGLHRPAIYAAIPTLKEKGLVSERKVGKLVHYAAESPKQLRTLFSAVRDDLDSAVSKLARLHAGKTPLVRRLDGKAGVHAVFEDVLQTLKKGDVFYRYSTAREEELKKVGLPNGYEEKRDAKQIERFVISNDKYIESREPELHVSLKIVPKDFLPFDYNVTQLVYGNKIALIDYDQPVATIIENEDFARLQRDIFRMLFKKL